MKKYIIINKSKEKLEFLSFDSTSGGYPYWSSSLNQACYYTDIDRAKLALTSSEFVKPCKMSDGAIHPPTMIHDALGLCTNKQSGTGEIVIAEIEFKEVYHQEISGKLYQSPF